VKKKKMSKIGEKVMDRLTGRDKIPKRPIIMSPRILHSRSRLYPRDKVTREQRNNVNRREE